MKTLVVYDSAYGNTEEIAKAVGRGFGEDAQVKRIEDVMPDELGRYEVVVFGSPTQAGRPSPAAKAFLGNIPAGSLKGIGVAGFDTRIDGSQQGFFVRMMMGFLGFAAGRIARQLEAKGGRLVAEPHGFFVQDKEGPLSPGEVDRAVAWASTIVQTMAASQ